MNFTEEHQRSVYTKSVARRILFVSVRKGLTTVHFKSFRSTLSPKIPGFKKFERKVLKDLPVRYRVMQDLAWKRLMAEVVFYARIEIHSPRSGIDRSRFKQFRVRFISV